MHDTISRVVLFTALLGFSGCSSSQLTTRIVETPSSKVISYGGPRDVAYSTEADATLNQLRVTVYRQARCDVIPVVLVDRVEEKSRGGKVIERVPMGKRQVADGAQGSVPCDQTYASDVEVLLEVATGRFSMGRTDAHGTVHADLAQLFQVGAVGQVPTESTILIRPSQAQPMAQAGRVDLAELGRQQVRVTQLTEQLKSILASGRLSREDSARAYELYESLFRLAPDQPQVVALSLRFWELVSERKHEENVERLERNLAALKGAQDTLKVMGDAALPIYVQVAVNSGSLDRRALEWSSLRLLSALRGAPEICAQGFRYSQINQYQWPADARIAAQYSQFAYGAQGETMWNNSCRRF